MTEEKKELTTIEKQLPADIPETASVFFNMQKFAHCQRIAQMFLSAQIWPSHLRTVGDAMIVLNLAERLRVDPVMLAQGIYIVHGKPGLEGKLIISLINNSKRFEPLQFEEFGNLKKPDNGEDGVIAYAKDLKSGVVLKSPKIDWDMAVGEGWYNEKKDKYGNYISKWRTGLAPLMFRYRSATFFARTYCPEVLLGMQTSEELTETVELQQQGNVYQVPQQPQSKQISASKSNDIYADTSKKQDWVKPEFEDEIIPETVEKVEREKVDIHPWNPNAYIYQRAGNFSPGKKPTEWNGYAGYCIEHRPAWETATDGMKKDALVKWEKLYGNAEFPLPMPEENSLDHRPENRELSPEQQHRVDAINELHATMPDHYNAAVELLKSSGQLSTGTPCDMNDEDVAAISKKINELVDAENQ